MKISIASFALVSLAQVFAQASAPAICITAPNPEHAYLQNVEQALINARLQPVPYTQIVKTVNDSHDPEYQVRLNDGSWVHVNCDDSGDAQCSCQVVR